jgi:hypothetical protein
LIDAVIGAHLAAEKGRPSYSLPSASTESQLWNDAVQHRVAWPEFRP